MLAGWGFQRGAHQNPLAWAKGISAGLWVDLEVSWALATGKQPSSTCMREWGSGGGTRCYFMIGCPLAVAAVLSCKFQADRWISRHFAVRTLFDYDRWSYQVTQPVRFSPLWPASWLPAVDKSRGLSLLMSRGFGRRMMTVCSSCLGRMLFFWVSL